MKKVVYLPLDERPCNYDYPIQLASIAKKDIEFVTISQEKLGLKKRPAEHQNITQFLFDACADADYLILAIDTLLYGGIIPSRLHEFDEEQLTTRLNEIKVLKEKNPKLKIFAYHLIMRCPSYSSNDEEPDYYATCGREIHLCGHYQHLSQVKELTKQEREEKEKIEQILQKEENQIAIKDYLHRRKINLNMNLKTLDFVSEGIIDFLIIPQDDSAPYGYTAMDQMLLRDKIFEKHLEFKAYMYPDADAVCNTLLARTINQINQRCPSVFIRYNSSNEGMLIPLYEDRNVSETIKYHILAANGRVSYDILDCDLVCMVNLPSDHMQEAVLQDQHFMQYQINRNLIESIEYIDYLIQKNKPVIVADIAYANGGDKELISLLKTKGLLYKINAYAGWNTSSNTLGTCIPHGMIQFQYGKNQQHYDFLALRYLEDVGYMSIVRHQIHEEIKKEGMCWTLIDGVKGKVSQRITKALNEIKYLFEDETHTIEILDNYQPWNRLFETGLKVTLHQKTKV